MTKQFDEQLSAFVDGELDDATENQVIKKVNAGRQSKTALA